MYIDLSLGELQELLCSKVHEHRLTALLILVSKYQTADVSGEKKFLVFILKIL